MRRLILLFAFVVCLVQGWCQAAPAFTDVPSILALSPEAAQRGETVKLRAQVLFHSHERMHLLFVHDGKAGIYVMIHAADEPAEAWSPGTMVDVEGITGRGGYRPMIQGKNGTSATVRVVGRDQLPQATPVNGERLHEPSMDAQWVDVRANVKATRVEDRWVVMDLDVDGWQVKSVLPMPLPGRLLPWDLVERDVRVRAIAAAIFNRHRQMTARVLYVPSWDEVSAEPVRQNGPAPLVPTNALLRPASDLRAPVRVRGIVTLALPASGLFLRGEGGGLWVRTGEPVAARPGSMVEVCGVPALAPLRPELNATAVQVLREETPPLPIATTAEQAFKGELHADLISLEGDLLDVSGRDDVALQLRDGPHVFQARLSRTLGGDALHALPTGGRVRVTGICAASTTRDFRTPQTPDALLLLLRDAGDVALLRAPPFWTERRISLVLGCVTLVTIASGGWILTLRRRVATQTQVIREQLGREAVYQERIRIARDLHDDLGAQLTRIGLLGRLARKENSADEMRAQFLHVAECSGEAVRALDAAIWALRPENDTVSSLASYLCQTALALFQNSETRCRLDVSDDLPCEPLEVETRHQLFLATKEALNNAARHAQAREVMLRVHVVDGDLHIAVQDDGRGMMNGDHPGRNGLGNMQRRIESLGGRWSIGPLEGGGTEVRMVLPLTKRELQPHPYG